MRGLWMALAVACTGTEPGEVKDGDDEEAFVPAEGNWTEGVATFIIDECGVQDDDDDDDSEADYVLTLTAPDTFTLVEPETATATTEIEPLAFSCTLTGRDFTCVDMTQMLDLSPYDGVLTISASWNGSFTSETEMNVEAGIAISCEGPDCEVVAETFPYPLPCETRATETATHSP